MWSIKPKIIYSSTSFDYFFTLNFFTATYFCCYYFFFCVSWFKSFMKFNFCFLFWLRHFFLQKKTPKLKATFIDSDLLNFCNYIICFWKNLLSSGQHLLNAIDNALHCFEKIRKDILKILCFTYFKYFLSLFTLMKPDIYWSLWCYNQLY